MNTRIIEDISNFIFIEDSLKSADVIMIPGGSYPELPEKAAELWINGYAPIIIPSGGVSIKTGKFNGVKSKKDIYNKQYSTECDFYTDVLIKNNVDPKSILCEDKSAFTAENAEFSKQVLNEHKIDPKTAILCCKNFHARRCLMFYQFVFPDTEFIVVPVPYYDKGTAINKENWYKTEVGLKRVLGELQRLGNQFNLYFENLRDND